MNPLKLAIVGAGPSAFYVASRLLKLLPEAQSPGGQNFRVHIYDRLWAPYGLVRYGVAPDHPEVKNCTHKFDQAASDSRLRFFGNVDVVSSPDSPSTIPHAVPLSLSSIFKSYTHVLFATGCTLPTLHPSLPPSAHCIPALNLVHWYTQHPNGLPPPALENIEHVSLIGNGNVSLDVARMLLTDVDVLRKYDVPENVLDVLGKSRVKHVSIIGRRGPLEAAFTMKELRELINLPEASMAPLEKDLIDMKDTGKPLTRQQSRVLELLKKGSKKPFGTTKKTWSLDFFRAPIGLSAPTSPSIHKATLSLAHTSLDPTTGRAIASSSTSSLQTDLVVTSLGFHGDPTSTFYDPSLRHLRNVGGRVVSSDGNILRGVYTSGWAANGAKGVLMTTMMDAYAVADAILADSMKGESEQQEGLENINKEADPQVLALPALAANPKLDSIPLEIQTTIKEKKVTQFADWKRIDAEETQRGTALGKERERMSWEEARRYIGIGDN